jgi:hypothetical protein
MLPSPERTAAIIVIGFPFGRGCLGIGRSIKAPPRVSPALPPADGLHKSIIALFCRLAVGLVFSLSILTHYLLPSVAEVVDVLGWVAPPTTPQTGWPAPSAARSGKSPRRFLHPPASARRRSRRLAPVIPLSRKTRCARICLIIRIGVAGWAGTAGDLARLFCAARREIHGIGWSGGMINSQARPPLRGTLSSSSSIWSGGCRRWACRFGVDQ